MKKTLLILALVALGACAPRRAEVRTDYVAADTLRALLTRDVAVALEGVTLTPRDTLLPSVRVERATLAAASRAAVASSRTASLAETPAPPAPEKKVSTRMNVIILIILLLIVSCIRLKKG